ncbi:MAG: hypothetical protein PHI18_08640, partial [bacterium]|nr:hypothetical protein [bacterium]
DYFLDLGADDNCDYSGGNWAQEWCAEHPGDPLCEYCSCAHSQSLNCNRKGRAFWYMLARLEGWPSDGLPHLTIILSGSNIVLHWDAVAGADSYKVYSSAAPDLEYTEDASGTFDGTSWTAPATEEVRCYRVTAVTE